MSKPKRPTPSTGVRLSDLAEGDRVETYDVGSGFVVVWKPVVHVDETDLDVVVDLEVAVEDGRLVVNHFSATRRPSGPPVSIEILKRMPLVGLASRAAPGAVLESLKRRLPGGWVVDGREDLQALPEPERVAIVYRAAYFLGLPPTTAVAEVLGVTREVAAKRVQAARWAGLLEPTKKGKKGA